MSVTEEDKRRFDRICSNIIATEKERNRIGELSEKTVHAVFKEYFAPQKENQEVKIGRFYADICAGNEITEIQTAHFDKLREKLNAFLTDYVVTVVYPIPHVKYMIWIDPETGELSKKRKSPKTGTPYQVFRELYKIKNHLKHPNLRIRLVLFDAEEYRMLNGWSQNKKKGSTRFDRLPTALFDEIYLECAKDYLQFVPYELDRFTSAQFAKSTKMNRNSAGTVLNILYDLGVVDRVGKNGNSYLYEAKEL